MKRICCFALPKPCNFSPTFSRTLLPTHKHNFCAQVQEKIDQQQCAPIHKNIHLQELNGQCISRVESEHNNNNNNISIIINGSAKIVNDFEDTKESDSDEPIKYDAIRDPAVAKKWTEKLFVLLKDFYSKKIKNNTIIESFDTPFEFNDATGTDMQQILAVTKDNQNGLIFSIDTEFPKLPFRKSIFGNSNIVLISFYGNIIDTRNENGNANVGNNGDFEFDELKKFLQNPVVFDLKDYTHHHIDNDDNEKFEKQSDNKKSKSKSQSTDCNGNSNKNSYSINYEMLEAIYPVLNHPYIAKVYHNYAVDYAAIMTALECLRYKKKDATTQKLTLQGFAGDTMHMARLLNAGSKDNSLRGLSQQFKIKHAKSTSFNEMEKQLANITVAEKPYEYYQYSAKDPLATVELYLKLRHYLQQTPAELQLYNFRKDSKFITSTLASVRSSVDQSQSASYNNLKQNIRRIDPNVTLWDVYETYWLPFGQLLVDMEETGFQLDSDHLKAKEKEAIEKKDILFDKFKKWAISMDSRAELLNVTSRPQMGHFFFAEKGSHGPEMTVRKEIEEEEFNQVWKQYCDINSDLELNEDSKIKKKFELGDYSYTKGTKHYWKEGKLPKLGLPLPEGGFSEKTGKPLFNRKLTDVLIKERLEAHVRHQFGNNQVINTNITDGWNKGDGNSNNGNNDNNNAGEQAAREAIEAIEAWQEAMDISIQLTTFLSPLQAHSGNRSVNTDRSDNDNDNEDEKVDSDSKSSDEFMSVFNDGRIRPNLNLNTQTGRLSSKHPNLQNQPSIRDQFQVRKAFVARNNDYTLIIADFEQIELRVLGFLSECMSMLHNFKKGGDFHSRTAAAMYPYIQNDIDKGLITIDDNNGKLLLKNVYPNERHQAKTLNFSIAYGKTAYGFAKDLDITLHKAQSIIDRWYADRPEVKKWQFEQRLTALKTGRVCTILGRPRYLLDIDVTELELVNVTCDNVINNSTGQKNSSKYKYSYNYNYNYNNNSIDSADRYLNGNSTLQLAEYFGGEEIYNQFVNYVEFEYAKQERYNVSFGLMWKRFQMDNFELFDKLNGEKYNRLITISQMNKIMRRAINTPVQGSAADLVMQAMLNLWNHTRLKQLNFKLLLQIHDEIVLEGPKQYVDEAIDIVRQCMENPWQGIKGPIVDFKVDIRSASTWYKEK